MAFENGTLIKEYKADCWNSGNHMTQFHEELYRCNMCHGTGWVYATKEQIRKALQNLYDYGGSFSTLYALYRYWKKQGYIVCLECEGHGEWYKEV
jgi:hypothetical protein